MREKEIRTSEGSKLRSITLFLLILVMLGILILLQGKDVFFNPTEHARVEPGVSAPNFTYPGLDGRKVSLTDYKGKVILLNIWATWCLPCVEEMPSMERLFKKLQGKDFVILAVSIDASGAKAVAPFMKKHNLTFPALIDQKGTIRELYGTTGIPESFIINKEGILVKKIIGPLNWASPEVYRFFRNLIQKS